MQTVDDVHMALVRDHLNEITKTLNSLRDLGIPVSARYDAIITDHGFILPAKDGRWEVRMKISDPEMIPRGDPEDD